MNQKGAAKMGRPSQGGLVVPIHYNEDREYENNINEIRIEQGFSILALANKIGINKQYMWRITQGYEGPMYAKGKKAGTLKPWAKNLAIVFGYDISQIFPREFCSINENKFLVNSQVLSIVHSYGNDLSQSDYESLSLCIQLMERFLDSRSKEMVYLRHYKGLTLQEVADQYSVSKERARQIIKKAIRLTKTAYTRMMKGKLI